MLKKALTYSMQVFLVGFALGLPWGPVLRAQTPVPDAGCRNSDFSGQYVFQLLAFDLGSTPALQPRSGTGSLRADGDGKIVAWHDWLSIVGPEGTSKLVIPNDWIALAEAAGSEVTYSVEPDCRITIMATLQLPTGVRLDQMFHGALANGGREAFFQAGGAGFIGTFTVKRTEAFDAETKRLLDRIAVRLSIVP